MTDYEDLCESLSMTEIIRLRDLLLKALNRRFERSLAVVFSDVVGSTPYFAKFGDEAGRALQQRHLDMLNAAIKPLGGRVVDTAGDGAFLCFESTDDAASAMIELQMRLSADNLDRQREHQLSIRVGIHHGPVLTDGVLVSGDSVNFCSRVAGSADPGQIRLSKAAFVALTKAELRSQSDMLPPQLLKGFAKPVEVLVLHWRDRTIFPTTVQFDTGEDMLLPDLDVISFGRLREQNGVPANDVVLHSADLSRNQAISRWHFELRRRHDGFVLRPISNGRTEVDGKPVSQGEEVPVRPGSTVRVADTLTLTFVSPESVDENATSMQVMSLPTPTPRRRP